MKKSFIIFILFITSISIFASTVMAASTRVGKRKFKKYCLKKCHNGDDAEVIDPTHMTITQWETFFENNQMELKEAHPNGELNKIKKLKPSYYKSIEQFLVKHAADSEQPETCG
jgi:hypothetical protein